MNELVIRADAGAAMGAGHLMRSLALAEAWRELAGPTKLLTRCESPGLLRKVQAAGVEVRPLAARTLDDDLTETMAALAAPGLERSWLCVDGYAFTPEYHRRVRSQGHPLLVIDDTAELEHYHADVVVNQNIGAEALDYPRDPDTVLLLGTRFALLRSEFRRLPRRVREPRARVERILVTLGAADAEDVTSRVVRAIRRLRAPGLEVRVVAGAVNRHAESLRRAIGAGAGSTNATITQVQDPPSMADLMEWPDLAIAAGGSTNWELAYLGVPTIIIVVADNQRGIAAGLHAVGAAHSLGWHAGLEESAIAEGVLGLAGDPARRRKMSHRAMALVDGRGSQRVVRTALQRVGVRAD